jgi:hypothetical protein
MSDSDEDLDENDARPRSESPPDLDWKSLDSLALSNSLKAHRAAIRAETKDMSVSAQIRSQARLGSEANSCLCSGSTDFIPSTRMLDSSGVSRMLILALLSWVRDVPLCSRKQAHPCFCSVESKSALWRLVHRPRHCSYPDLFSHLRVSEEINSTG